MLRMDARNKCEMNEEEKKRLGGHTSLSRKRSEHLALAVNNALGKEDVLISINFINEGRAREQKTRLAICDFHVKCS